MKRSIAATLCLGSVALCQPCFAEADPSVHDTSELSAAAALVAVATPVVISGAGICLTAGTGHQLVRFVDASGNALGELTADGFNLIADAIHHESNQPYVKANNKSIPLVVRNDYLELNEKVMTK